MATDATPEVDEEVVTTNTESEYDFDDPSIEAEDSPEQDDAQPETDGDEEPAAEGGEPAAEGPQFDPEHSARAAALGLSLEDFTPDSLGRTLAAMDRSAMSVNPWTASDPQSHQAQQQQPAAEAFKIELDPEQFDPQVIQHFEKMRDHYDGQLQQLRQQNEAIASHYMAEQQKQFTAWADAKFSGLGEAFEGSFGKGSVSKITPAHVKARNEVIDLMDALRFRDPNLSDDAAYERAVRALHFDKYETQTRQEISKKVAERSKGIVGAPTRKATKERTDPMSELRSLHKKMLAENGD